MEEHTFTTRFNRRQTTVSSRIFQIFNIYEDFSKFIPCQTNSWAVDGNFIFGEWLIGSCQHILIQEYVRLLNSWCEWNKYSREFNLLLYCIE